MWNEQPPPEEEEARDDTVEEEFAATVEEEKNTRKKVFPLKNEQPPLERRGSAGKINIVKTVKARFIRQPSKLVTSPSWDVPPTKTIHIFHFLPMY